MLTKKHLNQRCDALSERCYELEKQLRDVKAQLRIAGVLDEPDFMHDLTFRRTHFSSLPLKDAVLLVLKHLKLELKIHNKTEETPYLKRLPPQRKKR